MKNNYKRSKWKYEEIIKINKNLNILNIHSIITPSLVGKKISWFKGSRYCEILVKKGHTNYKLSRLRV